MATVAYIRVSSTGQSLDVQRDKVQAYGVDKVFEERASGKTRGGRPALKNALDYIRDGDTVVVTKIDRLARSTSDLLNIIREIEAKGAAFKVLDQSIDTTSAHGKLTLQILASVAEFENAIRAERQADGIKKALVDPTNALFKRVKTKEDRAVEVQRLRAEKMSIKDIMEKTGLSKASVFRLLKEAV